MTVAPKHYEVDAIHFQGSQYGYYWLYGGYYPLCNENKWDPRAENAKLSTNVYEVTCTHCKKEWGYIEARIQADLER